MVNDQVFTIEQFPDDTELQQFVRSTRDKIRQNMLKEGTRLMGLMRARTPYRNGSLKNSGLVQGPDDEGNDIIVVLSFGNDQVNYAIPVHERINLRHRHGRAKFMESVVQEEAGNIAPNITEGIR